MEIIKTIPHEDGIRKTEILFCTIEEVKNQFENPRKIKRGKLMELRESLVEHGDFGIIVLDEKNNLISGTQRVSQMFEINPQMEVIAKRLIGYTEMQLKAINIEANEHKGEWDIELLNKWIKDLGLNMDTKPKTSISDRKIDDMELLRFEKYNYIIIAFKTDMEFTLMQEKLGIMNKKVMLNARKGRKLKARAVWFDKLKEHLK
tara:strand:+ start:152 stop:763 length:612 start_codon:yes stop_codon:yes gene_type:complete